MMFVRCIQRIGRKQNFFLRISILCILGAVGWIFFMATIFTEPQSPEIAHWPIHRYIHSSFKYFYTHVPSYTKEWVTVENRYYTYLYSAYLDNRFYSPFTRVMCYERDHRRRKANPLYCHYLISPNTTVCVGPAKRESMNLEPIDSITLNVYNYKCPLPEDKMWHPLMIQLTNMPDCTGQTHWIPVTVFPKPVTEPSHTFAVCISPRHNFKDSAQLVESIETNKYFGATSITIYNHSIGSHLDNLLNEYETLGLVTIIEWKLPQVVEKRSHYFGQEMAINDCVYRHIGHVRYLALIDTDEFIVPQTKHMMWKDLAPTLEKTRYGSFQFLQVPYFAEKRKRMLKSVFWKGSETKYEPIMFQSTIRNVTPSPENKQSKVMVRPETIEYVGVHLTWTLLPTYENFFVPCYIAILRHYRRDYTIPSTIITDESFLNLKTLKPVIIGKLKDVPVVDIHLDDGQMWETAENKLSSLRQYFSYYIFPI